MNRITYLSELYERSITELTKSRDNWMELLSCMARYYKYSFDNNVLIYAQRPDASLLATMDIWNSNKIGRWVNKGAKSIAVIDLSNPKASLKYLFDLMDTNGSHESFRHVMSFMWDLEEQYRPGIIAKFHDKYNADTASIESCIYDLVGKRINDILPDYMQGFSVTDTDSILYDLPIEAVREQFSEIVRDSVSYMVFKKCGLSTDMFEEDGFENISHFSNMELFMRLGSITVTIARPILREINLEIENIKYERSRQNEYEAIDRTIVSRGSGRDAVPPSASIGERAARPDGSGQVRETVEGIHDRTSPTPGIGINRRGQLQPDDNRDRRGSREPQGSSDTGALESPTPAKDRGHAGESGPYEHDLPDSGGNDNERSGPQSEVAKTKEQDNPPNGSMQPLGGFLLSEDGTPRFNIGNYVTINGELYMVTQFGGNRYVMRSVDTKSGNVSIHNTSLKSYIQNGVLTTADPNTLEKLFGYVPGEIVKINNQPYVIDSFDAQIVTLLELERLDNKTVLSIYDSLERVPDFADISVRSHPTFIYDLSTEYDDEEMSELVDLFFMADDVSPLITSRQHDIFSFFSEDGHDMPAKANIIKSRYGSYNSGYHTSNGADMYIRSSDVGMIFYAGNKRLFLSYLQLADKIDRLILHGVYPFSAEEILNDYAIPDEVHEMQGVKEESSESITHAPIEEGQSVTEEQVIERVLLQGNITQGGKERIQTAMLSIQSKQDRVSFIRSTYGYTGVSMSLDGGGHYSWNADSKGIAIDYLDSTLSYAETLSWSRAETLISELVKRDAYLQAGDITEKPEQEQEKPSDIYSLQLEPYTVVEPEQEPVIDSDPPIEQLNLFNDFSVPKDAYEVTDGIDNDNIIGENTVSEHVPSFEIGSRILHDGKVFEVLRYLSDGQTVELGDLEQVKNLNDFRGTERLPIHTVAGAKVLKDHYTDGEIAEMIVRSVQGGNVTSEEKDSILGAQIVNKSNDEYNRVLLDDFHSRTMQGGLNYRYSPEHDLYEGGPKTKCRSNIAAIKLLKTLHSDGRLATADEQIILAGFVGWGGLANALTPGKSGWETEYHELTTLLDEEEFKSAQESTTTAFYTGQNIIRPIYTALERFGFREGNILDPAMGTGNFYSILPERMAGSKLYGVELDTITGGIAKQLYPQANIEVKGFEEINYPDHFFDVAIGNIPFNSIKVRDNRYERHNFRIHDYFIAKTLDKVRGGGIIAFITSKYTLDKANPAIRKYIAQRAELIGAIRLPNNAFKGVSGTEATTDIIFLQKHDSDVVPDEKDSPWITIEENEDGIPINSYFIDHPEMVLGKMVFDESMYGNEKTTACHPREGDDLDKLLENAVYYLDGHYREPITGFEDDKETVVQKSINADPNVKNYCYAMVDDDLYYRENSRMYLQSITGKKRERIEGLIEIRSALRSLIDFQTHPAYDEGDLPTMSYETELQGLLDNLNKKYDSFVKKYGYINSLGNVSAFSKDSDAPLLRSIEQENSDEKGVYDKTAVFYKATIKPKTMPKSADSAEEALKISLNIKGRVDLEYMQWLCRRPDHTKPSTDEIIAELDERIYLDPARYMGDPYIGWVTVEEYLSGNVKCI